MSWTTLTLQDSPLEGSSVETFGSLALTADTYLAGMTWANDGSGIINQAVMTSLSAVGPRLVQVGGNAGSSTTFTWNVSYDAANTAGNCLILDISFNAGSFTAGPVTVTDSNGNGWTESVIGHPAFQGFFMATFVATNCQPGPNTLTITIGGAYPFLRITAAIHEYSGVTGTIHHAQYGCGPLFGTHSPVDLSIDASAGDLLHLATSPANPHTLTGGGFAQNPCFTGWLVINEPGSLSPVTDNTWTDQSHYLHTSEAITVSWIARQRGTAKVPLIIAGDDDYMPTIGSQVCLWDITETEEFEVFSGTIDDFEVKWLGQSGARIVTLTCVSLEQVFDTIRLPVLLFENQTAGDIFTALFAYSLGSPVALGTVQAGETIANFLITDYPTLAEAFTRLATLSQYVWGVDPSTTAVYFTAPDTTPSPFTVDAEDVLWEQFTLKEERHDYRNRQILKVNSNTAVQSSELFVGAGQSSFTMLRPIQQITNAWLTNNTQNSATGTFSGQPSDGDTISFGFTSGWTAGATIGTDQVIVDSNGYAQKCTVAGTTGGSEPAWIEVYGEFTTDNTVQWQNQGVAGFGASQVATYTFKNSLDNREFGQVLIGANLAATIQNLADAINSIQFRSGDAVAGATFSLPTWENPEVNAENVTGTTFDVVNKPAGAGFVTALSKSCANFSWSNSETTGGITTFGTDVITFGVRGQTVGGPIFTIVYTPGSDIVTSATPLDTGNHLQIQYLAANADFIQVEDTADVVIRAHIESGTGKYQQVSSDDQALTLPQGLQLAQQQLAAYGVIPETFEFTTMVPGLYVGQVLAISMTSPDNAPALINGSWFIQELNAEIVPIYGDNGESNRWLPGGGHFRYTVKCINVAQIGDWIDFWLGLGGGSSSSSGSFSGTGSLGSATGSSIGGVNEQTTDYTATAADSGKIISMNPSSSPLVSLTLTLPATPPSTTWCIFVQDIGLANVDIDPGSLNIDEQAGVLTISPAEGVYISTDGINYFTSRGIGGGGGSVELQTNSVDNASQSVLNLVAGTNVTLTNTSGGNVTIDSTGGGGGAMVQIAQTVLGSAAASVTFSSISGSYSALMLTIIARGSNASNFVNMLVQFNSDTGNNYDYAQGGSASGSAFGQQFFAQANIFIGNMPGSTASANAPGSVTITIPGYAQTTFFKSLNGNGAYVNQGASATQNFTTAAQWRSTSAINAIKIFTSSGNFVTGSEFTLYGLQ